MSGHVSASRSRAHHPRGHLRSPEPGRPRPAPIAAAVPAFPTQAAAAVTTATGASLAVGNAMGANTLLAAFQGELQVLPPDVTALYGSDKTSTTLLPGQMLFPGDRHMSPAPKCQFIMQTDGNLVDFCNDSAAFASRTNTPYSRLVVQEDRNVVVYTEQNRAVLSTLR